jgi:hypothetical protein
MKILRLPCLLLLFFVLCSCANNQPSNSQGLVFAERQPRSLLILPAKNYSTDVSAPYVYLANASEAFGNKGYYVLPVALVDGFIKENGIEHPDEMHGIELGKLREHFGADVVLYATIEDWGKKFQLLNAKVIVKVNLRIVDLASGELLWQATETAETNQNDTSGDLATALISAAISQILHSTMLDPTSRLAAQVNLQLANGLPDGPYKPAAVTK